MCLVALALASGANAFVQQPSNRVAVDTQLNALWRNWIPQTADMMDLVAGPEDEMNRREFVVSESLDESDVGVPATERRSVSLLSKAKEAPRPLNIESAIFATSIALFTFVQASFAVSGGGLDFAGLDISNQDFSKGNYKGKDFTQVLARNTNFAGSNLQGCRFPKAYLINANYEGADVRGVSFEGTNMENTNLKVSGLVIQHYTEHRKSFLQKKNKFRGMEYYTYALPTFSQLSPSSNFSLSF